MTGTVLVLKLKFLSSENPSVPGKPVQPSVIQPKRYALATKRKPHNGYNFKDWKYQSYQEHKLNGISIHQTEEVKIDLTTLAIMLKSI